MTVFADYAAYYDLIYREKNYEAETEYICMLIDKFARPSDSILELGCGTGKHAICMAKKNKKVVGIDLSKPMIDAANSRKAELPALSDKIDFQVGDIRQLELGKRFDTVISMFHVLSYQTSNEDLQAVFEVAKKHLNTGGVFIFDFWYGPAVLTDRPEVREKRISDDAIEVFRVAMPAMYPNTNCVEVNYDLKIKNKATGEINEFQECHRMRYLFLPEIQQLLAQAGFKLAFSYEWMTEKTPDFQSWNVCCGANL